MVRQLVAAQGPQDVNPAVTMFLGGNGNNRTLSATQATTLIARNFMGIQLECAQCHDHPFADWKQTQYWGLASFFFRTDLEDSWPDEFRQWAIPSVKNRAANGMTIGSRGVIDTSEPRNMKNLDGMLRVPPQLLTGEVVRLPDDGPWRRTFAHWLTSPENPWFARSMVNRLWAQYFGRGLVNPIDDLRPDNPGTHPELLTALADEFAAGNYSTKRIVRAIVLSEAYGRSSADPLDGEAGELPYSYMPVRVLMANQLFDAMLELLGEPAMVTGSRTDILWERGLRRKFEEFFAEQQDTTAYQRGILQTLRLLNQRSYEQGIAWRIAYTAGSGRPVDEVITDLFRMTLSRNPTSEELATATGYVQRASDPHTGFADLLWVLMQSSEFALIR
jgi:hypothetical protein